MPLRILIDESVDNRITRKLQLQQDFDIISQFTRGTPDIIVIQLARKYSSIILTENRDFGGWVFAHNEKNVSVVYLRYRV